MPQIILEHVWKRFDKFVAVEDLSLVIEDRTGCCAHVVTAMIGIACGVVAEHQQEVPIVFTNRQKGTSKMSGGIFGEAFWGVMALKFRKITPSPRREQGES